MEIMIFGVIGFIVLSSLTMGAFCLKAIAAANPVERKLKVQRMAYMNLSLKLLQTQKVLTMRNMDLQKLSQVYKKTNEDLTRLNELKSTFFNIVTHEIRNPIGMISGFSDLLAKEVVPQLSEEHKKYMQIISESAFRANRLINDLSDLTAIENGKLKMDFSSIPMRQFLEQAYPVLEYIARQRDNRLRVECAPNIPPLRMDVNRLTQVLVNLVTNASKFTPKDGLIHVMVALEDAPAGKAPAALIRVKDEGAGFRPEEKDKIFQRFYQSDNQRPESGKKGLGLGLYIVREIVKAHNGEVWAESEGVGKGASFWVRLPLTVQEETR